MTFPKPRMPRSKDAQMPGTLINMRLDSRLSRGLEEFRIYIQNKLNTPGYEPKTTDALRILLTESLTNKGLLDPNDESKDNAHSD